MTPDRAFRHDTRTDALCLWHRMSIVLPACVRADGTAAAEQVAIVPPDTDLLLAALPHREGGDDPASCPGAALVGTREPDLSGYLAGHAVLTDGYSNNTIVVAQSRHAILSWLFSTTGFGYAPAALWKLAGWRIGWVASFLDQLRSGGAEGALIVAERQAAAALRQMFVAIDQPTVGEGHLAACGAVLVGRALIDLVTAINRVLDQMTRPDAPVRQVIAVRKIRAALAHGLSLYCRFLAEADRAATESATIASVQTSAHDDAKPSASADHVELTKLRGALKIAKVMTSATMLFAIATDHNDVVPTSSPRDKPVKASIRVLEHKLTSTKALMGAPEIPALDAELDRLNEFLSRLATEAAPSWRTKHLAGLARLQFADRAVRMPALDRIRTDLIYRLIVTRRLDQVYRVLPWMAALSDVFPGMFGGPLGAVAQLFEAGRVREIALELLRRLYDADDVARLDTQKGKDAVRTPALLVNQVVTRSRAGFLLAEGALSHHMAQAHLAGCHLDASHPIPTAVAGRLDWSFAGSLTDPVTAATVHDAELGKSIYATRKNERDLPTYMGLALLPMLGKAITDIFVGRLRGPAFSDHVMIIEETDKILARVAASGMTTGVGVATRELMRSVLRSLDVGDAVDADEWRSDDEVAADTRTRELNRADNRINRNTPADKEKDGGAIRRAASKADEAAGSPGRDMWELIDRARTWTWSKDGVVKSEDEPLELVLEGQTQPPGLVPLGSQFMYPLWFSPHIDRHMLAWLADGAPLHSPVAFGDIRHAGLIAQAVGAMRASAPKLYANSMVDAAIVRVMTIWFTGFSNIAADHVHVRIR